MNFLRQPKNLNIEVMMPSKVLYFKGFIGSCYYPLYNAITYKKASRLLYFFVDDLKKRKKAFFKIYKIILDQSSLGAMFGFRQQLNIVGVGYDASIKNENSEPFLVLRLGYSHVLKIKIPDAIRIKCPKPRIIIVRGLNLHKVSNFSAFIRSLKLPNTYKKKGIYYKKEKLNVKQGKKHNS